MLKERDRAIVGTQDVFAADRRLGGMFGRGQAWALEGLLPYYEVTKDARTAGAIETAVRTLLDNVTPDGAWPYNLSRKLMGIDCKATPVIASALYHLFELDETRTDCLEAAKKALE